MLVTTSQQWNDLLAKLRRQPLVVVDTETTGLEPWKADWMIGIGLAFGPGDTYYLPFRHVQAVEVESEGLKAEYRYDPIPSNLPVKILPHLWKALQRVPTLSGHNLKFDLAALAKDGYEVPRTQRLEDTLMASRLVEADKHADLTLTGQVGKRLGESAAAYDYAFIAKLKSLKLSKKHLARAPVELVGEYCEGDVDRTWKLREVLLQEIAKTEQTDIWNQECGVTRVCWAMELAGMAFDREYSESMIPKLEARIDQVLQAIYETAGQVFNVNSTPQLQKVMANLGLKSTIKSLKTGKESWAVSSLMGVSHPIGGLIVELRGLEKVKGTYFESVLEWPDDLIHAFYKNWGTITGRMSCTNPNLQNIAKSTINLMGNDSSPEALDALLALMGTKSGVNVRTVSGGMAGGITMSGMMALTSKYEDNDLTVSVRRLFIPREGFKLYFFDYSQMEIRVFADYVGDESLFNLLEQGEFDFHAHVAKTVWGVDESSELWGFYRTLAKSINFGLIYGIGIKKLAAQIQKTEAEAKVYKAEYFARFPKAEQFIQMACRVAEARGFVRNRFWRRYWIDPHKAYITINYLVQGTSADIVKNRMIATWNYLLDNQCLSRMLLQVHDELGFEVHESEEAQLITPIRDLLEERLIKTKLPVDVARGEPSWAQKKKLKQNAGGLWVVAGDDQ